MATIIGTSGDDVIAVSGNSAGVTGGAPTSADDSIFGAEGNDTIDAGAGNDTIFGDAGSDLIEGGLGVDVLDYTAFTTDLVLTVSSVSDGTVTDLATGDVDTFSNVREYALGSGNDSFTGSRSAETVFGGAGNDTFRSVSGPDYLDGGEGNDVFIGGAGNETIVGGAGRDVFNLSAAITAISGTSTSLTSTRSGTDTLSGIEVFLLGSGHDTFTGSSEDESIVGGSGNDILSGGDGRDELDGGKGNDTLNGGDGNDFISGKEGNDSVDGGAGNDIIFGDVGTDSLNGGSDFDTLNYRSFTSSVTVNFNSASTGTILNGTTVDSFSNFEAFVLGVGDDVFHGGATDDIVTGARGNDLLSGGGGNDTFIYNVNDGSDTIVGGNGTSDKLLLTGGNVLLTPTLLANISGVEIIESAALSTRVFGTSGNDTIDVSAYTLINVQSIEAGNGSDVVIGSAGNDTIIGGSGGDTLTGFGGNDTFVYIATTHSAVLTSDTITDFSVGDLIDLTRVDGNSLVSGVQSFDFIGSAAFSNQAGQLRAVAGLIEGDVNGDGKFDFRIILDNGYAATGSDFLFAVMT